MPSLRPSILAASCSVAPKRWTPTNHPRRRCDKPARTFGAFVATHQQLLPLREPQRDTSAVAHDARLRTFDADGHTMADQGRSVQHRLDYTMDADCLSKLGDVVVSLIFSLLAFRFALQHLAFAYAGEVQCRRGCAEEVWSPALLVRAVGRLMCFGTNLTSLPQISRWHRSQSRPGSARSPLLVPQRGSSALAGNACLG